MAQDIKKQEANAPARYWDPFAEMRSEMDHLLDSFLGRGFMDRPSLRRMAMPGTVAPNVDVRENEKELVFDVELPGMNEQDVNVTVRNGVLSITGEKKSARDEKKDTYHLVERSYGAFERSFRLPDTIDEEKIKAEFDKGVLHIIAAKRPEATTAEKKIPIGKS